MNEYEDIELQPIGNARSEDKDDGDVDVNRNDTLLETTHQILIDETASLSRSSPKNRLDKRRRVRKTYLSMILLAYILTLVSPGTILWSSTSSSCNQTLILSNTTDTKATSIPFTNSSGNILRNGNDNDHNNYTSISPGYSSNKLYAKCMMYGSINISVIAKLTCSTLVLILLFLNLLGSNPGLLTNDVMAQLDASECNNTTNINGSEYDDEEANLERQTFLEPLPLLTPSSKCISLSSPLSRPPMPQPKNQKLYPHTRRKYCQKCQIHPPLRSHHCNICNRCIATFDHHCLFLDTCIGERNHFRFWLFVTLNVICLHISLGIVGTSNLPSVGKQLFGFVNSNNQVVVAGVELELRIGQVILILSKLYMYSIYIIATLLWIIHTAIALGNSTTFEMTKGPEHIDYLRETTMMDFPFGRGLFGNIKTFFSRDDIFRWIKKILKGEEKVCFVDRLLLKRCSCCKSANRRSAAKSLERTCDYWEPILWKMPECIERESEDLWNHPWQNKYWSCC